MIYRRCGRCGRRIEQGTRCTCRKTEDRGQQFGKKNSNDPLVKMYHTSRWDKARYYCLNKYNYVDVYRLYKYGELAPADRVHHIETAKKNPERFYDPDNHFPVSDQSHREIHDRYKTDEIGTQRELREYMIRFESDTRGRSKKF